ncbi:MAG: CPBP family intramembrane glutamic endopeptidase [Caldilinea sp.]|nr:CPBP family intramembrane metalloprotease [Caldilinea sp.]
MAGVAISAIAMAGIFLVGLLLGEIAVDRIVFDGSSLWTLAQYDLGIALFEEIVSRSLQQNGVYILLGLISALVVTNSLGGTYTSRIDKVLVWCKWPAILAIAALFGWVHIRNPGASPVTAFGNALGGLMYGIAFFGGRNIWLPLGMHFAWNFFQGPIFGFSVSGLVRPSVIVQQGVGSDLLMGGAYGPEGGLVGMAFRFVVIALVLVYLYVRAGRRGNVARLEFPIAIYDNPPGSAKPLFRRKPKATTASA